MPKKNQDAAANEHQKEGQAYDKIMRENLLELFLPLVAEQLNFTIKKVSPLPDKQPTTVVRETDSFLLIETDSETEPKFILHIEFERTDNPDMIYRMVEYHGIELMKYRLPIKHVVVYLGEKPPKMRTSLRKEEIFESFTLVNIHETSPQVWLNYDEPERIIMAILGNYEKENAKIILEAIIRKLRKVCKSDDEVKKFIKQLIIISLPSSRERNLESLTIKISNEMPLLIDIEKDYLYNLGLQKQEHLLLEAKEALKKMKAEFKKETAKAKAEAEKAAIEKAEAIAKAEAEKAAREKVEAIAKAEAEKAAREKVEAIAKAEKAAREKAEAIAKAEAEKAAREKAEAIAKAEAEKAAREKVEAIAKAEAEKAAREKAEAEKRVTLKQTIIKMKKANLEDALIMDFLNLDKADFDSLVSEIE